MRSARLPGYAPSGSRGLRPSRSSRPRAGTARLRRCLSATPRPLLRLPRLRSGTEATARRHRPFDPTLPAAVSIIMVRRVARLVKRGGQRVPLVPLSFLVPRESAATVLSNFDHWPRHAGTWRNSEHFRFGPRTGRATLDHAGCHASSAVGSSASATGSGWPRRCPKKSRSHGLDLSAVSAALPIGLRSMPDRACAPNTRRSVFCRASSSFRRTSGSPFSRYERATLAQSHGHEEPAQRLFALLSDSRRRIFLFSPLG